MMQENDRLLTDRFAHRLRGTYPDAMIWVFGSRARGDAYPGSDLEYLLSLMK